jgi:hypothetical protein
MNIKQVFLSCAAEHQAVAQRIAGHLRECGIGVSGQDDLPADASHDAKLRDAIDAAQAFVFLVSPEAVADGCPSLAALKLAREKWRPNAAGILPILIAPTEPPRLAGLVDAAAMVTPNGNIPVEVATALMELEFRLATHEFKRFDHHDGPRLNLLPAVEHLPAAPLTPPIEGAVEMAADGATSCTVPHVFISFSSEDKESALDLVQHLEAAGLRCWISARDVPFGDDYQDAICDAVDSAHAMLLLFSSNANKSREIRKELALASERDLFVLPVRIENVEPTKGFKYELATRQYIDFFEDRVAALKLIIKALSARQEGE